LILVKPHGNGYARPGRPHRIALLIAQGGLMNRDAYVQKMKEQLDQWNAEAAKWEAKAKEAQASMKAEYEKQIGMLHSRRDEAMYQLKLLQGASTDAWRDMIKGSDQALKAMQEAFNRARSHFEKNK
jgi:hypothetical protein